MLIITSKRELYYLYYLLIRYAASRPKSRQPKLLNSIVNRLKKTIHV